MKHLVKTVVIFALLFFITPLKAAINVFACEPEWASLVDELGGDRVSSYSATTAYQDPHHIEARPSLIAKVRRADLVICSGADLETAWLPLLLRQAGNPDVLPGKIGYFEASSKVKRLDIQTNVDRSMGDVHSAGNPHVHLDPARLLKIAQALAVKLVKLDQEGAAMYQENLDTFTARWKKSMAVWLEAAEPLKGKRIVVHHRDWVYLFDWLGVEIAGALEPKPGLPTTAGYLVALKKKLDENSALMIVHTNYQNPRPANKISQMTGIPVVELPYTVGAEGVSNLFELFDVTIHKMLEALK